MISLSEITVVYDTIRYDTTGEFNTWPKLLKKAECGQLNLADVIRNKKIKRKS